MNGIGFDAFARRAAAVVSRRTSLLALGGLALGAATQSAPVGANKKKRNEEGQGRQRQPTLRKSEAAMSPKC